MKNSLKYKFLEFVNSHNLIVPGMHILVAVSGGVDSVVLLHLLMTWQAYFKLHLGVIHFNHLLRGDASDNDENFVKSLCEKYGTPCYVKGEDVQKFAKEKHLSLEEAGRTMREAFFEECRIQESYDAVATAHHLNDQVETILMRLITGTGLAGLAGIRLQRKFLIRPLLFAEKTAIETYAAMHQLEYREDESNQDVRFLRNRIRHKLLPFLEDEFKMLNLQSFLKLSLIAQEWLVVVDQQTSQSIEAFAYDKKQNKIRLDMNTYKKYFSEKKLRSLEVILATFLGWNEKLTFNKFQNFSNWFNKPKDGRRFLLHRQICVSKQEGDLVFEKEKNLDGNVVVKETLMPAQLWGNSILGIVLELEWSSLNEVIYQKSNWIEFLDADQIRLPLLLRNWKPGDRFQPLGSSYRRKISDFLNDEKNLIFSKKQMLVLENQGEIIYVAGTQISENYKITPKTEKVLKVEIEMI